MNGNFLQSLGLPPELEQFLNERAAQEMQQQAVAPPEALTEPFAPPPPANIMQAAAAPMEMPQPAPVQQAPQPAAAPAEKPAHKRRSLLDIVGRAADVLARVGGADALYQPTLDSYEDRANMREDRGRMIDLEGMKRTLTEQQIAEGSDEAGDRGNKRVGQAVRGLQAIQARGGDIAAAWPLLAQQAGIPAERAAALGGIFTSNPQSVGAVASMLNGQEREFGMQPFYAADANGKLRAYQLGRDGTVQPIQLGEGETPIDPLKFVNTGGEQVGVGSRSGQVQRVLRNTVNPNTSANIGSRERIATQGDRTRRYIADTRPGPAGKDPKVQAGGVQAALANLGEIRGIYNDLNKMGAMVSPKRSTGANVVARVRASGAGQIAEGYAGTEAQTLRDRVASIRPSLMQSIAKATGMTGRQLDSNADVKLFMQTVTNPTASYEANQRAIAGLERFLKSSGAGSGGARPAAPRPSPRRNPSPRPAASGGWGKATVVR